MENTQSKYLRLNVALHSFKFAILLENQDRRIELVNQSFCDLFQIPLTPDQMVGLDCSTAAEQNKVLFVDENEFVREIDRTLEDKKLVENYELQMKDGRFLHRDYVPIFNEKIYIGHLWVYKDITFQKNTEAQVLFSLQKEKELNELKSKFVGMVSHEFRTPLAAISTSLELISIFNASSAQEKINNHIDKINEQINRMTELMNDVLLISKIESGNLIPNLQKVNIEEILNKIIVENISSNNQLLLKKSTNNLYVKADKMMLIHIFSNIISNSIKYSNSNSKVEISVYELNDKICIDVKDYGLGIPIDEQKNIFNSFYRASNIKNISGTGLGLMIVKHFMDLHKANISFVSKQNQGSTFTLCFPKFN